MSIGRHFNSCPSLAVFLFLLALPLTLSSARAQDVTADDLIAAVKAGDLKNVKALVAKDPKAVNRVTQGGRTALFFGGNKPAITAFLLRKGADPDARDESGGVPLFYAESEKVVKILIDGRADVNAVDYRGSSVLHKIAMSYKLRKGRGEPEQVAITELLISNGAEVNVKSLAGGTPLGSARRRDALVACLRSHGAKPASEFLSDFTPAKTRNRDWTSKKGKVVRGRVLRVRNNKVRVKLAESGKKTNILFDRFSKDDKTFLLQMEKVALKTKFLPKEQREALDTMAAGESKQSKKLDAAIRKQKLFSNRWIKYGYFILMWFVQVVCLFVTAKIFQMEKGFAEAFAVSVMYFIYCVGLWVLMIVAALIGVVAVSAGGGGGGLGFILIAILLIVIVGAILLPMTIKRFYNCGF